ncbi:MAG: 3-isopropylmalate dehydratase [Betaproteobacteria bacterium]|jgi:3-isopropylmalate/(R)-2-methylmalate dehydratase small subunit|nr:3-isopropylmalate dehydratase [Betaproteobacteria bacterium]NBT66551.1 3-isopropylmalate dehydratase [Betaproteobacteria bacterium]NBY06687.1 3-isopropylmalate dehydratase [Betaproteobacteria bacterium]
MSAYRVWRLGHNIDTDALAPGIYMKLGLDEIAKHCLESVRPEFASGVKKGDVLVAGPNFGIGSSREQAAGVLVQLGVAAVIAPSYSGLFFRNAFNLGLLLLTCKDAEQMQEGDEVEVIHKPDGSIAINRKNLAPLSCQSIPHFLMDMVNAGGLLPLLKMKQQGKQHVG